MSGDAIARRAIEAIAGLDAEERDRFLDHLAADFCPDAGAVALCADAYRRSPSAAALAALQQLVEPPRQELFRRLTLAQGGIAALIEMRRRVLRESSRHPAWTAIDDDLAHVFRSWFGGGFLQLRRVSLDTEPRILEYLIAHEAVHAIHGLHELHRRLQTDRRCFALVHPALPDEPLAFTELALTREMSADVQALLAPASPAADPASCRCAIFYSISSCHEGLRGVAFGNTLIRRVVDTLRRELPQLTTFATLSPIPGFRAWLTAAAREGGDEVQAIVATAADPRQLEDPDLQRAIVALCASYLVFARRGVHAADPVARFHLGNGARLERINWMGDRSRAGMERSLGLTANYVYSAADIERNHEEYAASGKVAASHRVELLAASSPL